MGIHGPHSVRVGSLTLNDTRGVSTGLVLLQQVISGGLAANAEKGMVKKICVPSWADQLPTIFIFLHFL